MIKYVVCSSNNIDVPQERREGWVLNAETDAPLLFQV